MTSTIGITTGSVATSTYGIHHFTCDITKIFQSPLPSLCILFHPSLAPPFSSSIAHYTIPRNLKTLLHITLHEFYRHCRILHYTTRVLHTLPHITLHHEFYRHCRILHYTTSSTDTAAYYITPRVLQTLPHITLHYTSSTDTAAYYTTPRVLQILPHITLHHEFYRHCRILHYTTSSTDTAAYYTTPETAAHYTIHHELSFQAAHFTVRH